jgi:endonuclease III
VKNASQCAKKLTALLKKLPAGEPPGFPEVDDPVAVLVASFLLWESNSSAAGEAYQRIVDAVVDFNDLRVSMPVEIAEWLGDSSPLGAERCQRLRAALRNIYLREHEVTLAPLADAGKREIKKYVESIEGVPPYVSARTLLMSFDAHAIPVDEQLRARLVEEGACDPEADVHELSAWLARQIKASDARAAHLAFQAWIDKVGPPKPARSGSRKKTTRKKAGTKSRRSSKQAASSAGK